VDETERYLIREIRAIKEQAKIEAARGAVGLPNFDMWVQVDDGSHRFDFMSKGKNPARWSESLLIIFPKEVCVPAKVPPLKLTNASSPFSFPFPENMGGSQLCRYQW
jgi:hypothetical protein